MHSHIEDLQVIPIMVAIAACVFLYIGVFILMRDEAKWRKEYGEDNGATSRRWRLRRK